MRWPADIRTYRSATEVTVHTFARKPTLTYVACESRSLRGLFEHEMYVGAGAGAEGANSNRRTLPFAAGGWNKDSSDRLLIAQSRTEGHVLATRDRLMALYDEPFVRVFV